MSEQAAQPRRAKVRGGKVIYPRGVEQDYGVSDVTRWRWEKSGRLPARDVFVGGVAVGWRPETLAEAQRGPKSA